VLTANSVQLPQVPLHKHRYHQPAACLNAATWAVVRNRSQQKAAQMAVLFAVFLIAVLVAAARAEGRGRRVERLRTLATDLVGIGQAVHAVGTEIVERAAARLAEEHRSQAGIDQFFAVTGRRRIDGDMRSADL
jgi:hypothetical protein